MFGLIVSSRPVDTAPQALSPTQYAFSVPSAPSFSHIVVFLLPGTQLPPDTAAAVYIQLPGSAEFKLLGAIANEKQSAIFKVNIGGGGAIDGDAMTDEALAGTATGGAPVTIGLSVEPAAQIAQNLAALRPTGQELVRHTQPGAATSPQASTMPGAGAGAGPVPTKILAQRIIQNAFNFLSSFAGNVGPNGMEVIPLKSFQDWWTKFEKRIEHDPGFLERDPAG